MKNWKERLGALDCGIPSIFARDTQLRRSELTLMLGGLPRARAADVVNLYTWSAGVDTVKREVAAFEKETGLAVKYNNLPFAQYREAMITKFVGQAPVDALWVSDGWLPEWADAGWLAPIDAYPQLLKYNSDVQDFCTQSTRYKGHQYGMTYYTDYMNQVSTQPAVGFIGLGIMGGAMAARLAAAGYPLHD